MSDSGAVHFGKPATGKRARTDMQCPVVPFAQPMARESLHRRISSVLSKAAAAKALKRGVNDVVKAIQRGDGQLVVIAGDVRCDSKKATGVFMVSVVLRQRLCEGVTRCVRTQPYGRGFTSTRLVRRCGCALCFCRFKGGV
jgi:hypothetical protein